MSGRKKFWLPLIILAAAGISYWLLQPRQAVPPVHESVVAATPVALASESPSPTPSPSSTSSPSSMSSAVPGVVKLHPVANPPTVSTLREEVQKDVHVTPPSLIRFGAHVGDRMKVAINDQAAASALMIELKSCALPEKLEDSPVQARALCIVSAQELGRKWPDLKADASTISEKADPEAVGIAAKIR